ncbi:MAG: phosphate transport system protein [Planctomycetota bacterium]|jgi:phosphate transport system protein
MFEWLKNLGQEGHGLRPIIENFNQMMVDGQNMFDLVTTALLGEVDSATIREELFTTDQKINKAEQVLRRYLVVHASVHGAAEFPTCLVLMSIAKDAERIGDYCKNMFDVASLHPIPADTENGKGVQHCRERVSKLLGQMIKAYGSQDPEIAKEHLGECDAIENYCDARVEDLIKSAGGADHVPAALAFRHIKRIVAHSKNITTSIVMPVDKLDFFDER